MSGTYSCSWCKKQMSCYTEGTHTKETIRVILPWMNKTTTVVQSGEQRLPCPDCERPEKHDPKEDFHITSWDNISTRLHCRVRQHYIRHHNYRLNEIYDAQGVTKYYNDARRLRCELLHGPPQPEASSSASASTSGTQQSKADTTSPATDFIFPPGAEENLDQQPGSIQSAHARMRSISGLKQNSQIPNGENFITWLQKETELAESTIQAYLVITRNFLGWLLNNKSTDIALKHAWNMDWVKDFLQAVKDTNPAPTTMYNYACALATIQKFLIEQGESTPTEREKAQWTTIMHHWSKRKRQHQKKVSQVKMESTPGLDDLQRMIIKNPIAREKFKETVQYCRMGQTAKVADFKWATGYAIIMLQSSNFKRNGNLAKIKAKYALDQLKMALEKIKAAKGKTKISCHFEVNDATKTGGKEIFAMIDPVKIRAVYDYCKYVRPNCPAKVQDDDLFVNTIGTSLKSKVSDVIQCVARSLGLDGVVIRDMRTRVETRAASCSDQVNRKEIAAHLAHTEETRDRHYLLPTEKRSKRAAADLEKLMLQRSSSSDHHDDVDEKDPYDLEREEKETQRTLRKRPRVQISFEALTSSDSEKTDVKKEPRRKKRFREAEDDSDKDPTYTKPAKPPAREEWESSTSPNDSDNDDDDYFDYDADGEDSRKRTVVSTTTTHQVSSSSSHGSSVIFIERQQKITSSFKTEPPSPSKSLSPSIKREPHSSPSAIHSPSLFSPSPTGGSRHSLPIHSPSIKGEPHSSPSPSRSPLPPPPSQSPTRWSSPTSSPPVPESLLNSEEEIDPISLHRPPSPPPPAGGPTMTQEIDPIGHHRPPSPPPPAGGPTMTQEIDPIGLHRPPSPPSSSSSQTRDSEKKEESTLTLRSRVVPIPMARGGSERGGRGSRGGRGGRGRGRGQWELPNSEEATIVVGKRTSKRTIGRARARE